MGYCPSTLNLLKLLIAAVPVSVLVTRVNPAKMAEPIVIPFGRQIDVDPSVSHGCTLAPPGEYDSTIRA